MTLGGVELCCPHCAGDLAGRAAGKELGCGGCGRTYPVIFGIPDLRVFPDPYIDIEADRAKGMRLAERFADFDFPGLVEYYYSITPAVPAQHARSYVRGLLAGVDRARAALEAWERHSPGGAAGAGLLDVGCGTAPLLVAAGGRYGPAVGVDIAFRWLVVAKRRLADAGLERPLVCACAEALPFRDASFGVVTADSVIETVRDQRRALSEARRVLAPGGRLFLATPNRFSLGPDPHIGVWAGGWLPRRVLAAVARRQGAVPPERRLLSARGLARLLRGAGFEGTRIFLPDVTPAQRAGFGRPVRAAIGAYQAAKRLRVSRPLLLLVGPLLYAAASVSRPARAEPRRQPARA